MTSRSVPTNALALFTARGISALAALAVAAIAARHLGPAGFGTYASVVAAGFVANTISTFGTDTLIVRSVSRGSFEEVSRSIGLQSIIVSIFVITAGLTVIAVGDRAAPLLIQACGLIAGIWATAATAVLRGRERMDLVAISTTAGALTSVGGAVVARAAGGGIGAFIIAVVAGQIMMTLVAVRLASSEKGNDARAWLPSLDHTMWIRSSPFAIMVGASAIAASTGLLALHLLGTGLSSGYFAAANRLSEGLRLLPAAAFGAAFPAMARGVHLTKRYVKGVRVLTVATALIVVVTLGCADIAVSLVFGEFDAAADVLRLLSLGLLPLVWRLRWSFELIAEGAEREVARIAVISALLTVGLSVLGASWWGAKMVALATVISLCYHALGLWNLRRRTSEISAR